MLLLYRPTSVPVQLSTGQNLRVLQDKVGIGKICKQLSRFCKKFAAEKGSVLLPENLRAYFELSAQAWILYKAPQWNARYPNSCPGRIKL